VPTLRENSEWAGKGIEARLISYKKNSEEKLLEQGF